MQRVTSFTALHLVNVLLVLLLLADFSNGTSLEVRLQFQSLMDSGNYKGALKVAEEHTKLMPDDGNSWYVAHEQRSH
jgi:hypothetical protein